MTLIKAKKQRLECLEMISVYVKKCNDNKTNIPHGDSQGLSNWSTLFTYWDNIVKELEKD